MTMLVHRAPYSKADVEAKLDSEKYATIPEITRRTLKLYLFHRLRPGSGVRGVLENEGVSDVIARLDDENRRALPLLLSFLWNEVPSLVHGSKARVAAWLAGKTPMFDNWVSPGQADACSCGDENPDGPDFDPACTLHGTEDE